ncbi:MAG TPA: hypothetical protein VN841_25500, partial [Bryobacteraceae bacterium]|nr:hypothetical protein [Bryobacteraceae bacterium]
MALDGSGNLFIADDAYQRIRKVSPNGIITSVAGTATNGFPSGFSGDGGPATAAGLSFPSGVVVDSAGNLFFADSGNGRIREITADGIINTVAGAGPGLCCFSGDGGPATASQLNSPWDLAVDGFGNVFIADLSNRRVRKVAADGYPSHEHQQGRPRNWKPQSHQLGAGRGPAVGQQVIKLPNRALSDARE